jgi:hypothetical protein
MSWWHQGGPVRGGAIPRVSSTTKGRTDRPGTEQGRLEVLERLRGGSFGDAVFIPILVQQVCLISVGGKSGRDLLQTLRMAPGPPETAEAQGHQDAHGNHAGMARLLFVGGDVDKGAEAGVGSIVDKVDEILGHGVEARRQALVFDGALELEAGSGTLPFNGVAGLDIEVDEEEGGDGRKVGKKAGRCSGLGELYGKGLLPTTDGRHGQRR